MHAGAHDDNLAFPLPAARATELFVILRMALLWWLVVPVTHCVSVEARSPSGWDDGVEVTTRRAPLCAVRMPTVIPWTQRRITQRFPKYMRRLFVAIFD